MLLIGDLRLSHPLILAPMSGISDLPFRLVTRPFGCGLAFTEMINAGSLARRSRNTLKMLSSCTNDRPLGVQILGSDHEAVREAMDIMAEYVFDVIDFNAACPVNKVVSKGSGAALLSSPLKLISLLGIIIQNTRLPVTLKLRSGWDEKSTNALDIALMAEDAGVKGVFIHGRTRQQGYSGRVNYKIIREIKKALKVPVIASGDALSPVLIKKLIDETGCDGVAIARGALGNPWIFRETIEYLQYNMAPCKPDITEITKTMRDHLALNLSFYGETAGIILFRKFFGWYTKGMAVKELKIKAFHACTRAEMSGLINELEDLQPAMQMFYARE